MKDSEWQEIDRWFARALELPAAERVVFLSGCADADVRARVDRLLAAAASSDKFMKTGSLPTWAGVEAADFREEARLAFPVGRDLLDRYRVVEEIGAGGMASSSVRGICVSSATWRSRSSPVPQPNASACCVRRAPSRRSITRTSSGSTTSEKSRAYRSW